MLMHLRLANIIFRRSASAGTADAFISVVGVRCVDTYAVPGLYIFY